MEIIKTKDGSSLSVSLIGRLDTTTAPKLEEFLAEELDGVTDLSFDFGQLQYVSSAGLRVILASQKRMNKLGRMVVKHVNEDVGEVFEITGFSDILTIE